MFKISTDTGQKGYQLIEIHTFPLRPRLLPVPSLPLSLSPFTLAPLIRALGWFLQYQILGGSLFWSLRGGCPEWIEPGSKFGWTCFSGNTNSHLSSCHEFDYSCIILWRRATGGSSNNYILVSFLVTDKVASYCFLCQNIAKPNHIVLYQMYGLYTGCHIKSLVSHNGKEDLPSKADCYHVWSCYHTKPPGVHTVSFQSTALERGNIHGAFPTNPFKWLICCYNVQNMWQLYPSGELSVLSTHFTMQPVHFIPCICWVTSYMKG